MKILALEFSSAQRSVAVVGSTRPATRPPPETGAVPGGLDDEAGLGSEAVETGAEPNRPFEMVESVLRQASLEREEIDGLAIGLGPGSYTGIRAAIALAQGWQLARKVKLVGISSADVIAAQANFDGLLGQVGVVIDAQRGEFYLAEYELTADGWRPLSPLSLVSRPNIEERQQVGVVLVGPDVIKWFPGGQNVFPRASTLGKLALAKTDFVAGEKMEPIYLRPTSFVKAPPPRIFPD